MNANKIPRWLECGRHGAVLKDAAGLVYGTVRQHDVVTTMWIGLALTSVIPPDGGEFGGVQHFAPTKELAMKFVVDALAERGRI